MPDMLIPLFPLGNALFPDGVIHLRVFEVRYLDMIKKCIAEQREFGIVPLLAGREVRTPEGTEVLASAGTMARIDEWSAPMPALLQLRCSGTRRFQLSNTQLGQFGLWTGDATFMEADPVVTIPDRLRPATDALGKLIAELQQSGMPPEQMPLAPPFRLDEAGWVANRWCELLPVPLELKQRLMELDNPLVRLELVGDVLERTGIAQ